MSRDVIYQEKLRSGRTTGLFMILALLCFSLGLWRWRQSGGAALAWVLLGLGGFFLFYVFNFRTLVIRIDHTAFQVRFGLIRCRVPLGNIGRVEKDLIPWFLRNGGAGVHFFLSDGLYRVNFNFLEYDRLLIRFKERAGFVQALSCSTRQLEKLKAVIQQYIVA